MKEMFISNERNIRKVKDVIIRCTQESKTERRDWIGIDAIVLHPKSTAHQYFPYLESK